MEGKKKIVESWHVASGMQTFDGLDDHLLFSKTSCAEFSVGHQSRTTHQRIGAFNNTHLQPIIIPNNDLTFLTAQPKLNQSKIEKSSSSRSSNSGGNVVDSNVAVNDQMKALASILQIWNLNWAQLPLLILGPGPLNF